MLLFPGLDRVDVQLSELVDTARKRMRWGRGRAVAGLGLVVGTS
jgi:hypothetical protein